MTFAPLRRFVGSRFGRGAATIVVGTALGQLLTLAGLPLLSRLFSPEAFGAYAVLLALSAPLGFVAALRLDVALPTIDDPAERHAVAGVAVRLTLLLAAVLTVAVALFGDPVAGRIGLTGRSGWLWILPALVPVSALQLIASHLALAERRYRPVGAARFAEGAGMTAGQVSLGALGVGPFALAIGLLLRFVAALVPLRREAAAALRSAALARAPFRATLRRFHRYTTYASAATFLQYSAIHVPSLLLASFFGATVAGFFSLAQRTIVLPINLLTRSVGSVFLGEAAARLRAGDRRGFRRLLRWVLLGMGGGAAAIALALMIPAPWLFATVFGEVWRPTGELVRLLAPMFAVQFVTQSVVAETLAILDRQRLHFGLEAFKGAAVVAAFVLAASTGRGPVGTVALYSAFVAIAHVVTLVAVVRSAGGSDDG